MRSLKLGNRGFSLTELMFAMTILAIGLLALAQMQMMAMRGTTSAREFSTATKIAREGMEQFKIPGAYVLRGQFPDCISSMEDHDNVHNTESDMAPDVKSDTNILALNYDMVEVFDEDPDDPMSLVDKSCGPTFYPANCDGVINSGNWDYVRITNIRHWPLGSTMQYSVMKEISVTVLWKERGLTRSVNIRTLVGRKDNDFY